MKYWLLATAMLFSTVVSAWEMVESPVAARALVDAVMAEAGKGNMKAAMLKLRPYSTVPQADFDSQLNQIELQLPAISKRFGKVLGYELLETEEEGRSLIAYTCLQKFERHAMVWRFVFYKPADRWQLDSWHFDDNIQTLF